ncbi:ATP-binding cassette domain-containing protein [Candidatus Woesearchaeota archaeon]|nr:ATP-binding cassette domain-containing protein [Candidatus Woesearchaeota archaeon]
MIKTKNLYFKYEEDIILKNISIEIKEGSFTAIIGANGSGKTTLAKHFNALLMPAKGEVLVGGTSTKKDELNARKKVGFVFQNFEDQLVYPVVEEDIAFGLENMELGNEEIKKSVDEILKELNITHLAKRNVNTLSMGQKQLIALAGVLAMKPKCIVFDEPTTNLDEKNKKSIMGMIRSLNKKYRMTIILITNVLNDLRYADEIVVLKNGIVIFSDKKSKLESSVLKEARLYD